MYRLRVDRRHGIERRHGWDRRRRSRGGWHGARFLMAWFRRLGRERRRGERRAQDRREILLGHSATTSISEIRVVCDQLASRLYDSVPNLDTAADIAAVLAVVSRKLSGIIRTYQEEGVNPRLVHIARLHLRTTDSMLEWVQQNTRSAPALLIQEQIDRALHEVTGVLALLEGEARASTNGVAVDP